MLSRIDFNKGIRKVQMKFIEASKKKDAHTEEWIVIILSVIFAFFLII